MSSGHRPTSRRIRVLRVIARLNVGGPALQVVNLARGLDPDQFETRLLAGHVGPNEADYLDLRAPDVAVRRIIGLGRSPNPVRDAQAFRAILHEIHDFRPDVVHTHTAKAGVLGRLAGRAAHVPALVHTFHGHLLQGYFSAPVTKAVVRTERTLARMTTRLVAVGGQVRDDLLQAGIGRPEQYVVVPPGVALPTPPDQQTARRILGLRDRGLVVALVARLTGIKRPDRFAEVAIVVAGMRPDVTFVIAGDGPLLDEMRQQMAPLGDRARFLGWTPEVGIVYAASDVVALTSDNEGMPVSLIEAAHVGRPAVTTDVGSAREVVVHEETGYVVERDVDSIARALTWLLDDPDLRLRMGNAAAARAAAQFSAERLVHQTESLYREVVGGSAP